MLYFHLVLSSETNNKYLPIELVAKKSLIVSTYTIQNISDIVSNRADEPKNQTSSKQHAAIFCFDKGNFNDFKTDTSRWYRSKLN